MGLMNPLCKEITCYEICENNSQMGLFKIERQRKVMALNREEQKKLLFYLFYQVIQV
jgi:hypothetical protein